MATRKKKLKPDLTISDLHTLARKYILPMEVLNVMTLRRARIIKLNSYGEVNCEPRNRLDALTKQELNASDWIAEKPAMQAAGTLMALHWEKLLLSHYKKKRA